jgi:rfaE bifunctional protein kinase chain/domain
MKKVAVFGDSILDVYSFYEYLKESPEADVPTIKLTSSTKSMGGAGLLAQKLHSLGNKVDFYTSFNDKDKVVDLLNLKINIFNFNYISNSLTIKNRMIYKDKYIYRIDDDDLIDHTNKSMSDVIQKFKSNINQYDAVVFSDYNKGFLNSSIGSKILDLCENKVLTFLDPKPENKLETLGWDFIKPNIKEGIEITKENQPETVLKKLHEISGSNILMTSGPEGCYYYDGDKIYSEKTLGRNPIDVSGCGDIAMASFIHNILDKRPIEQTLRICMSEASLHIDKFGNPL